MKTVQITEILEFYDRILLFAACDPIGGNYLCEAIDTVGGHDRYAVVGDRPEHVADFRAGRVDLRTLMPVSPGGEWYITVADGTIDDPLVLEPQHKPLEETDYLPGGEGYLGSGFYRLQRRAVVPGRTPGRSDEPHQRPLWQRTGPQGLYPPLGPVRTLHNAGNPGHGK